MTEEYALGFCEGTCGELWSDDKLYLAVIDGVEYWYCDRCWKLELGDTRSQDNGTSVEG